LNGGVENLCALGWFVYFLLKIILDFLLGKTRASLNFKTELGSQYISPGVSVVVMGIGVFLRFVLV
jgi:hypothetical protein